MRSGFDFADIIDEVIVRAFGETSVAEDVTSARRSIYLVLEEWHALQYNTWRVRTRDFTFQSGFPAVNLPVEVDDVISVSNVLTSGNETPMRRMPEAEYAQVTNKAQAGQPSSYLLRRTEPPVLTVYPTGVAGQTSTLRITYVQRPEVFDRMSDSIDAPGRWLRPLIFGAAADLASKTPERSGDRIMVLQQKYTEALALAVTNDRDRSDFRMRIG